MEQHADHPVAETSLPDLNPGREYYSNVRHEMTPFIPRTYSRVLEVGCGEGVFATLLSPPFEMWGVEPEAKYAARATERLHKVLVGRFDEVSHELPERYFDLVVCNDVIEHLPDPELFLRSIQRCMTPGAHLIASIPNMRHWEVLWQLLARKDWQYGRDGIMDRTHLKFFTEKSIRRLFHDTGFEVERASGINGPFDPVRGLILKVFSGLTLGYYGDIKYRQFGALVRLR